MARGSLTISRIELELGLRYNWNPGGECSQGSLFISFLISSLLVSFISSFSSMSPVHTKEIGILA